MIGKSDEVTDVETITLILSKMKVTMDGGVFIIGLIFSIVSGMW
jgi:hypothetical protein